MVSLNKTRWWLLQVTSDTNGHLEMCLDDEGRIAALLYCGTSLLSLKDPLETPV